MISAGTKLAWKLKIVSRNRRSRRVGAIIGRVTRRNTVKGRVPSMSARLRQPATREVPPAPPKLSRRGPARGSIPGEHTEGQDTGKGPGFGRAVSG
jgi:hypothetical protein